MWYRDLSLSGPGILSFLVSRYSGHVFGHPFGHHQPAEKMEREDSRSLERSGMEEGHLGLILSFPIPYPSAIHGVPHYDIWVNGLFDWHHGEIEGLGSGDKRFNYYIGQLFHFLYLTWRPTT